MSNDTTRIYNAEYNLLAVSLLLKETALNTAQTLSHTLLAGENDLLQLDPRNEDNRDEQTGYEEADLLYRLGNLSSLSFNPPRGKPQDFLLGLGYGLGSIATSAWGTGFKHACTPLEARVMPGLTAAQRIGKTIMKRRCPSLFVDSVVCTFAKDSWAKIAATLKGTGRFDTNMTKETVNAAYNAASLTLAANPVIGSSAAERLQNVHQIRVKTPTTSEWTEVAFSVVSDASPAVITITPPGEAVTLCDYEIIYCTTEDAWMTFPARVDEPPLRVQDLAMKVGGKWNGTTLLGGRTIDVEINSVEYTLNNNMIIEYRPGGTGDYASYAERGGRVQTLRLDRQMREYILQQRIEDEEYFGVYLKATGAEFESGKNYYVELVFPRCAVLKAPLKIDGKSVAEAGDLAVLQDSTYGSIKATVANKIATCAA